MKNRNKTVILLALTIAIFFMVDSISKIQPSDFEADCVANLAETGIIPQEDILEICQQ
ncbi:MAG: hypothetical protein WA061_02085 [Microgenomates group bacterium]